MTWIHKIRLPLFLISIIILTILACLILREDENVAYGDQTKNRIAFNHGNTESSTAIMNYWRMDEQKKVVIKKTITLQLIFIAAYLVFLFVIIYYSRKSEKRKWLSFWLGAGLFAIVTAAMLDTFQVFTLYNNIDSIGPVSGMRIYTIVKIILLVIGIIPLLISMVPRSTINNILLYISQLLKSLWLFFPGILFLLLPIVCFWILGQGQDIITAFIENKSRTSGPFNYSRIFFFLAIIFWVYVSWYSSRIISYIKQKRQEQDITTVAATTDVQINTAYEKGESYFNIGKGFLDEFPRIIGNSCFLILELAILQTPEFFLLNNREAWVFFFLGLLNIYFINKWVKSKISYRYFKRSFYIFMIIFGVIISTALTKNLNIGFLFSIVVLLHIYFIYFINSRRAYIIHEGPMIKQELQYEKRVSLFKRMMDYFCIPRAEIHFYKWFLWVVLAGILFYLFCIFSLQFARITGPFSFIILAFGVLLAFGNIVTAFSVKYKINFHFIFFLLAFFLGLRETHNVRTVNLKELNNNYHDRPTLSRYLSTWLNDRNVLESDESGYDIYFVMANGGASRSGYWTAAVLGQVEDSSIINDQANRFSDHIFCLSGTSGGGVGVATFFSLLRNKESHHKVLYDSSAREFLKKDYFTYTVARMLGPDFFNYIFHISSKADRAAALEISFEETAKEYNNRLIPVPFSDSLSEFPAISQGRIFLPALFINTTRMQDGNPGVVTNLELDSATFNNRVDVLRLIDKNQDISIATGAILGARFPYLSPAGNIKNNYFVDGGYFDNSGAGVVQEMIRGILNIAKEESKTNSILYQQISKLNFKIIHIVNSPVDIDSSRIKAVSPIQNDLLAPILTIIGAYDMQTTVNDGRLHNFIKDIDRYTNNRAEYKKISLYKDSTEWKQSASYTPNGKEQPYAMNWFMSDKTVRRIDERLQDNVAIKMLIKQMHEKVKKDTPVLREEMKSAF